MLANIAFFMLSVLHLAYLGLAFDSSSEEEQVTICLLHGVCVCVCVCMGGGGEVYMCAVLYLAVWQGRQPSLMACSL